LFVLAWGQHLLYQLFPSITGVFALSTTSTPCHEGVRSLLDSSDAD
jgi:hypothetical protein